MILVFGGAYQGKLDFIKEEFNISAVSDCSEGSEPDFAADAIYGVEGFVMNCVRKGIEARDFFKANREMWQDKVIVMTDTSQGVVPIDKDVREFREMNGRLMLYLAGEADRVIRVFCGIGKEIK